VIELAPALYDIHLKERARRCASMGSGFPNPVTHVNAFKRYLNILTPLQKKDSLNERNANSLANIPSSDERDEILSDAAVRKYIKIHLAEEMGIDVLCASSGFPRGWTATSC
jgi:hypothetical protein